MTNKTMKIIITSILTFSLSILYGQNYIDYYDYCNEGDKQIYLKNDSSALENFKKAFLLVDYVHAIQYKKASICAAHIRDYEKTYLFAKNAILNGNSPKFLKHRDFKAFRKTEKYKSLKDSIVIFSNFHIQSINLAYKREVDSLQYIDQRIIRKNKSFKGNYNIDKSDFPENLFGLDSLLFNRLFELINQYGFPSEKAIGPDGYSSVWVLLHHNIRLEKNSEYLPMAKEALMKGQYLPKDYAWMYDQSLMFKKEKPLFYFGVAFTGNLSDAEKKKIDENRKQFGIKPLESMVVRKTGNAIIQKRLW
ncbi:MAG: hypothetical protein HRT73_11055 [Flavobacteriales bacterium]|nr:hypothetical protein [Flavobacteriales bacterium]